MKHVGAALFTEAAPYVFALEEILSKIYFQ
jgi:hypothetical protein